MSYSIRPVTGIACVFVLFFSDLGHVYSQDMELKMVPEYERMLKRVVVSLDAAHPTLDLQEELLEKLPKYSDIVVLAPREQSEDLNKSLRYKSYGDRVTVVPFRSDWIDGGHLDFIVQESDSLRPEVVTDPLPIQWGTLWAQDLFEVGWDTNDSLTVLTPPLHMAYWQRDRLNNCKPVSDIDYLYTLSSRGIAVKRLPFVFSGGNILTDTVDGRTIAFCGGDILRHTQAVRDRFPQMVAPPEQLPSLIREHLDVDDVLIAGYVQPTLMFHLDQAMMLLGDRQVAVLSVTGPLPDDARRRRLVEDVMMFTADLTMRLEERGYAIILMEATADDVLNYRLPANGIVFTHAETGARSVIFPVYSGRTAATYTITEQRNINRLTGAGLEVIPLFTRAFDLRGGPHCMINVLE